MDRDKNDIDNRIVVFDYIKFVACFAIFWSHYNGIFTFGSICEKCAPVFYWQSVKLGKTLFNGNIWICVFCFISGYLINSKKVNSFSDLIIEIALRYIKFVCLFFVASIIVLIISVTIGFPGSQMAGVLGNYSILDFYTINFTFTDILKSSFLFWNGMLPQIWMIKCLLIGNYIVLFVSWISSKTITVLKPIILVMLVVLFYLGFIITINNWFYISCFLGAIFALVSFGNNTLLKSNEMIDTVLKSSLAVYILHVPILYSFSLYLYLWLSSLKISLYLVITICFLISSIIVIVSSLLFSQYVEKSITVILKQLKKKLKAR